MNSESSHLVSGLLSQVIKEAFAGAPGPWTYFTDNRGGVGLLSTLERRGKTGFRPDDLGNPAALDGLSP